MASLHALLLTDVVDSTRLTEQIGDAAMAALWAAHDRMARDLLPPWRGREIDKTDGMLMLFETVADAVGCAQTYQQQIRARGWPITARAGIHFGALQLRTNPTDDVARGAKPIEVSGLALPLVARVMSVALGGQVLLSADARLALGVVPHRLQSHGHWRLQGLAEPVELFEVGNDNAPFKMPLDAAKAYRVLRLGDGWRPVRDVPHSLPAERDPFVGRVQDLMDLAGRFEAGARLVSLLGMGGTGKTRLATHYAWTCLGDRPGGVWFCDLSQARDVDGIQLAVAQGLGVPLGGGDTAAQLEQAIAGRGPCLVVLDNFEQVAAHAEATLGHFLDHAPDARFIVTSREVLGLVGEETMALSPLSAGDGVALFLRRAQAARAGTALSAAELSVIQELVSVLDGLPLAIELAAARSRVMSPSTMLARMQDRFELLGQRGGRPRRQATLRAAFDWSWDLLTEAERAALAHLSVFERGFTLAAAAAVLPGDTGAAPREVELVQALLEKSFVHQVSDDRFDLLQSVRVYAAQHLRTEGHFAGSGPQLQNSTFSRHAAYFAGLDERAAVAGRCVDLHNLMAACRRATAAGNPLAASGALVGAWAALRLTGPYSSAVELAKAVEAMASLQDGQRAWVDWVAGTAQDMLGDVAAARAHFQRGLARASSTGDGRCSARLLLSLGSRQTLDGDLQAARDNLNQSYQLAFSLGDRSLQAQALNALGRLMDHQARFNDAREQYERALELARELQDRRLEGGLLGNLGGLYHDVGNVDQARRHFEQALALAHEVGDQRWAGNAHCNLGLLYQEQGQHELAREQFDIALSMAHAVGHVRLAYTVRCNLGLLLLADGKSAAAEMQLRLAIAGAEASSDRRSQGQFRGGLALALARQGQFEQARESLRIGRDLLLAMADQLSQALLLCDRTDVELLAGEAEASWKAYDQGRSLAVALQCGEGSELGRRLAGLRLRLLPS